MSGRLHEARQTFARQRLALVGGEEREEVESKGNAVKMLSCLKLSGR